MRVLTRLDPYHFLVFAFFAALLQVKLAPNFRALLRLICEELVAHTKTRHFEPRAMVIV